ncbi:MAG: DUF4174 domain-containing protein [Aestuariibacter sp.]
MERLPRIRLFVFFFLLIPSSVFADFLDEYRWENRLILVKSQTSAPMLELMQQQDALREREIIWFCLKGDTLYHNSPRDLPENVKIQLLQYFAGDLVSLLIGKDGIIKSKDNYWDLENYLKQVDTMPMRQQEMSN